MNTPVFRGDYRGITERCFGRLKEYRRIATRYDKTARNYLAMVKTGLHPTVLQKIMQLRDTA